MEQQTQGRGSPQWYRNVAIVFSAIAGVLLWAAITQHDWVYWAFAGITALNAIMTMFKFFQVRETKS
jgi:membrane protein YdbS with pleckstrin-like domain